MNKWILFLGMGLLSGFYLLATHQPWQRWVGFILGFMGVVFVAEVGQLQIPNRHFDWGDIAWGSIGALAGITLGTVGTWFLIRLRLIPLP